MKKHLLFLLLIPLLLVSCILNQESISGVYKSNPFLEATDLGSSDTLTFPVLTDVHILRENRGQGISHPFEQFFDFCEGKTYPFAVSLGDLSDDGSRSDKVFEFIESLKGVTTGDYVIEVVGNHDRQSTPSYASVLEERKVSMHRYTYGCLSIYALDDSTRTFTSKQLDWLEQALKADTSRYKLFLAHENVCAGGNTTNTLFMSGLADVSEMNRFFSIMETYSVGLLLTGHTHSGNHLYRGTGDKFAELNLASFVATTSRFEPGGYWYEVSINLTNGSVIVDGYNYKTQGKAASWSFVLP